MIERPMKPQWFQILLALGSGHLHGFGIQRAVLAQTDGSMRLWPAMLYRSLSRLEAEGLIEAVAAPKGEPDDERRQYYGLTVYGRARLREETEILARWVELARGGEPA